MNLRLFRDVAIIFLMIGILDFFANKFYLYWTTWWIDMILHFVAGAVVAMSIILVLQFFCYLKLLPLQKIFGLCLAGAFGVGLAWEFFELYIGATYLNDGIAYWTDTLSDLFLDGLGGYLGYRYSMYILNKYGK